MGYRQHLSLGIAQPPSSGFAEPSRTPGSAGQLTAAGAEQLLGDGVAPTRSEMQDRFQRTVIEAFGLPQPLTDTVINGFEVDIVWPHERVIVELDGWEFHRDRKAFIADRERDAIHADHGYVVIRITWERLCEHPRREAERLLRILRRRRLVTEAG